MMRQNLLRSVCAFLIGWILLEKAHGCEDQCYKPNITSIHRDENDMVVDAVCYSFCASTVRMLVDWALGVNRS